MSLWYCTKCGRLIKSMICRCGQETSRVTRIDTNGFSLEDSGIIDELYKTRIQVGHHLPFEIKDTDK